MKCQQNLTETLYGHDRSLVSHIRLMLVSPTIFLYSLLFLKVSVH